MSHHPQHTHSDEFQAFQFPQSDVHYPPSMSRTTTAASSTTTFVKHPRPNNESDEDLEVGYNKEQSSWDQPQTTIEPAVPTKRWHQYLLPKALPLRLFLMTVIIETIFNLAIQGDIFSRLTSSVKPGAAVGGDARSRVAVYLIIFALAHVFQLVLAVDAIASQNTLQFIFLTGFNALFLIYSIIQAVEIKEINEAQVLNAGVTRIPLQTLTILSHVIIAVAEIAFIALGWQIWREFGWKVYKFLGADISVKRMFKHYQIFLCLIKFDLFFFVAFSVQLIFLVLRKDDWEYYLTIAALPLSVLLLIEAYLAARHENKWLMGSFMLGCLAASVYFAYKLFRIWQGIEGSFKFVYKSLTIFAALSLFCLLITGLWGWIVMRNFGKGLTTHLSKQPTLALRRRGTTIDLTMKRKSAFPMSANPNRMSIE